jgi:hypothetical protein
MKDFFNVVILSANAPLPETPNQIVAGLSILSLILNNLDLISRVAAKSARRIKYVWDLAHGKQGNPEVEKELDNENKNEKQDGE